MSTNILKESFALELATNELLLHKICRLYGNTTEDREDLFQEILVQAWKGYEKFRGESKFSTWLYQVALNTAIAGVRRKKRTITLVESATIENIPDTGGFAEEENLRQLYAAISCLNKIEKAMTILYLEERSYKEMEVILGINEGALRVKMNRVKEKLRQILNTQYHGTR